MKRVVWCRRIAAVSILAFLCACTAPSTEVPEATDSTRSPPSIVGRISDISQPWITVETPPGQSGRLSRARVRLLLDTQVQTATGEYFGAAELRVGQQVRIWFAHAVANARAAQADASLIRVVEMQTPLQEESYLYPDVPPRATSELDAAERLLLIGEGLDDPEAELAEDLMKHNELIPCKSVQGGVIGFYSPERIVIKSSSHVVAGYEDGHIPGTIDLSFSVTDGAISWRVNQAVCAGQ